MTLHFHKPFNWIKIIRRARIPCKFQRRKMAGEKEDSSLSNCTSTGCQKKVFCFELKGGPFYFTLCEISESRSKRQKYEYPKDLQNCAEILQVSAFVLDDPVPSTNASNGDLDKNEANIDGRRLPKFSMVHNMLRHNKLRDRLKALEKDGCHSHENPGLSFSTISTVSLDQNREGAERLSRGFVLLSDKPLPEGLITDALKGPDPENTCYLNRYSFEDGEFIHQSLDEDGDCLRSVVVPVSHPAVHPAFLHRDTIGIFHSYERSVCILNECSHMPEVTEMLSIASEYVEKDFSVEDYQQQMKHPFIVLEGLDATGKSTLVEKLGQTLKSVVMRTPPDCVRHLREKFDSHPEILRRAYYSLGNYIVASQIASECKSRAVIMDRFWQSTAAYAIAHETGCGDRSVLPSREHWVYAWPEDLVKPSAILFLTVNEDIRDERLTERNTEKLTHEEQLMRSKQSEFRERLLEAYTRMRDPSPIVIDASKTKEEVAEEAIEKLREMKLLT